MDTRKQSLRFRLPLFSLVAGAGLAIAAQACAQSCSATVPAGNYGNVDILSGGAVDTSANFTISCTGNKNQTVRLCIDISYGNTVGGAGVVRALVNGTLNLLHDIYSDAARSSQWGAWGGPSLLFPFGAGGIQRDLALGAAGSASLVLTMYGRIAASQQTVPPGTYAWSTASPGFSYFYGTAAACPSGTLSFRGGVGSDVWQATILPNCLVTASNVDFGASGVLAATIDAQGAITARCTSGTPYTVQLNGGLSGATDPTLRKMTKALESVTYGLYLDAARSLPFGSALGTNTASGTGTGLAQTIAVYGRVPAQTTPSAGAYADTITVTLTY